MLNNIYREERYNEIGYTTTQGENKKNLQRADLFQFCFFSFLMASTYRQEKNFGF